MAHIRIIMFLMLSFTLAGQSQAAESPLYFGLGIAEHTVDGSSDSMNGYSLNLGIDLDNYFSLEGIVMNSESISESNGGLTATAKIDYSASAMLRLNLRYNHLTLYLLGGYYTSKNSVDVSGTFGSFGSVSASGELDSSGFAYGAGIDIYGTKSTALTVRWMNTTDKDISEFSIDTITIGLHFYYDVPRVFNRY